MWSTLPAIQDVYKRQLHCHYIVHGINVGHLEVQTHILVQMTGGIVTLCTVNRADLVYTAECTGEVLLVELRGLCQISRSAKVIQLEQVCAALSACNYDLRGVDVGCLLYTSRCV